MLSAMLIIALLPITGLFSAGPARAAYVSRFSTLANGAITFTGNTLGLSKQANANAPGTNDGIGTFISTNSALRETTYPAGSTGDWRLNSSSATLAMPAGSTVLYAELIWSGSYSYGGEDVSAFLDTPISFTIPGGSLRTLQGDPLTASTLGQKSGTGTCTTDPDVATTNPIIPCFYVRSANVTDLVGAVGAGVYTVGGVPATQSDAENSRSNAGWTLAVVYGNAGLPARSLTLFVGEELTNSTTSTPVTVSGFCTPPNGAVSGRLLLSASEGDATRFGDRMQFGPDAAALAPIAGPNNPIDNFFASQLNDDSGNLDTRGTFGGSNQNAAQRRNVSAGRQGWDITNVDVSAQLANSQTSAVARGTSTGDQYVINALGTQINIGAPNFPPDVKTADALDVIFTDTPPPGTSVIANSLTVDGVAQPGANPAAGVALGTIVQGARKLVTFQVRVDSLPASFSYENRAAWTYSYISCAGQAPLSGSVITNPAITRAAAIEPTKSANPTGPVGPGQVVTYEVRVPNVGAANTAGSTLVDAIPAGTTYRAGTTTLNGATVPDLPGGVMPFTQPQLINSPGAPPGQIVAGAAAVVQFQVTVGPNVTSEIINIASADEDGPSGPLPPREARTFNPVVNLAASKTDTLVLDTAPPGGSPGDTLEYTIAIVNRGSGAASDVRFTDGIPANTAYVPNSTTLNGAPVPDANGAMPFVGGGLVNSPGAPPGQIAAGATATVTFRITIANPLPTRARSPAPSSRHYSPTTPTHPRPATRRSPR
jgi:uncharacterized repeat protein (TIGR01451 family)